ncbi:MAG: formylglycine-generating enzyme family protein [Desulfobacterales bacterium]|nr:formylglycine-generating enzyme family protein [Desulfobacterales bacterium]
MQQKKNYYTYNDILKIVVTMIGFLLFIFASLNAETDDELARSLDEPHLIWKTGGEKKWEPVTDETHDHIDALKSGKITNNEASFIETQVNTSGTLTFWWKVSSEENADRLELHINNEKKEQISGDIDWENKSIQVKKDDIIKWVYIKDLSDSSEKSVKDSAWLDEIEWISSEDIKLSIKLNETIKTDYLKAKGAEFSTFVDRENGKNVIGYEILKANNLRFPIRDNSNSSSVSLEWEAVPNRRYIVYGSNEKGGAEKVLSSVLIDTDKGVLEEKDVFQKRIYRIELVQPPEILSSPTDPTNLILGKSEEIFILADGTEELIYNWYKKDKTGEDRLITSSKEPKLKFESVTSQDAGVYYLIVIAKESRDQVISKEFKIEVKNPPKIKKRESKIELVEGVSRSSIETEVMGEIPISYQWYRNGGKLEEQNTKVININVDEIIRNFKNQEEFRYTIQAENDWGKDSFDIFVRVIRKPEILKNLTLIYGKEEKKDVNYILEGDEFEVCIDVLGTKPMEYIWLMDGLQIQNNSWGISKNTNSNQITMKAPPYELAGTLNNERRHTLKVQINNKTNIPITSNELELEIIQGKPLTLQQLNGLRMIKIDSGSFIMGSNSVNEPERDSAEFNSITVRISRGFWISETEITQQQWETIMGHNPSYFKENSTIPVHNITWNQIMNEFCKKLNELEKALIPKGYQFRLPTEAEWEYVCRAGTNSKWSIENMSKDYRESYKLLPVKDCLCNKWNIFGIHGNVWEFCYDSFTFPDSISNINYLIDPFIRIEGKNRCVLKGGSNATSLINMRCASRDFLEEDKGNMFTGFRIVLGSYIYDFNKK